MKLLLSNTHDAAFNIATEEHLIGKKEDFFFIYINSPSIIVGKNQNTLSEINFDYIKKNNIKIVRRLSGGGAVYHDLGNINFSFIVDKKEDMAGNYEKFSRPVIKILQNLGIDAKLKGRNDLVIGDRKFSGNAQFIGKDRLIHHGTLLFDTNLSVLKDALNVDPLKIQTKGIPSVAARVTNISEHLANKVSVNEFINLLIEGMNLETGEIIKSDMEAISKLVNDKYNTWDWNFGYSPKYNFTKKARFECGGIEVFLLVENGIIMKAKIYGDFFSGNDILNIENLLCGVKHNEIAVLELLHTIDIENYFIGMNKNNLLSILF